MRINYEIKVNKRQMNEIKQLLDTANQSIAVTRNRLEYKRKELKRKSRVKFATALAWFFTGGVVSSLVILGFQLGHKLIFGGK